MALVHIARFADLTEVQVAAAALRASGIEAVVHDELGQTNYLLQTALGGFRLAVPERDAADASAYIAMLREVPREPVAPKWTAKNALALVFGLLFG